MLLTVIEGTIEGKSRQGRTRKIYLEDIITDMGCTSVTEMNKNCTIHLFGEDLSMLRPTIRSHSWDCDRLEDGPKTNILSDHPMWKLLKTGMTNCGHETWRFFYVADDKLRCHLNHFQFPPYVPPMGNRTGIGSNFSIHQKGKVEENTTDINLAPWN